jgi:hypothetical protein
MSEEPKCPKCGYAGDTGFPCDEIPRPGFPCDECPRGERELERQIGDAVSELERLERERTRRALRLQPGAFGSVLRGTFLAMAEIARLRRSAGPPIVRVLLGDVGVLARPFPEKVQEETVGILRAVGIPVCGAPELASDEWAIVHRFEKGR